MMVNETAARATTTQKHIITNLNVPIKNIQGDHSTDNLKFCDGSPHLAC